MYTVTVPKKRLNSMSLPGVGRSIEVSRISPLENVQIRQAFAKLELQVEFEEEPGKFYPVTTLWPDPHSMERLTLFID